MKPLTLKLTEAELKEASKSNGSSLTEKFRDLHADPIRASILLEKDLKDYQEGRRNLKRKAEAKPWTPSKPGQWARTPRGEFNGTVGKFAKSGSE